ncbi:hypothetical protein, partial [Faecalibacterium prausnitzii]|uniref:hypothetical protein n=1 Tax=Faecalibacterium prausnitzii TaxID=853 RepID=UPI00130DFA66
MNEQTSNPTSGQNVPKSKFRRKSRQEQTTASKLRMERRGESYKYCLKMLKEGFYHRPLTVIRPI